MLNNDIIFAGMPGGWEIALIALVILLIFGAKRLPGLARGLGQGIREFKGAVDGVKDERYYNADGTINEAALVPGGFQPGTTTPFEPSYYGVDPGGWLAGDFHWIWDHEWASFTASINNITDEDPPASRQEFGYDPRIGNPLGRTFEVGIRKTF